MIYKIGERVTLSDSSSFFHQNDYFDEKIGKVVSAKGTIIGIHDKKTDKRFGDYTSGMKSYEYRVLWDKIGSSPYYYETDLVPASFSTNKSALRLLSKE